MAGADESGAGAGGSPGDGGKTTLPCPCGEWLRGGDEDELVAVARKHLAEAHPGKEYTRDEILFMAF